LVLQPVFAGGIPYDIFFLAVMYSALSAGVGPGILALVLGALAAIYYLIPPTHAFSIPRLEYQVGFALYLIVGAALIALAESQRRSRVRLNNYARLADENRQAALRETAAREQAEHTERLQRRKLETTLACIGDGVIAIDLDYRVTFINRTAAELSGYPREDSLGVSVHTVFNIRNEHTGAVVENPAIVAIREKRTVTLANDTVLVSKSDLELPITDTAAPITDEAGTVVGAVLVFRDVSAAKDVELRLRSRLIDLAHDAIIVADAGRRIKSWNAGAREMYGWEEAEARGHLIPELLETENAALLLVQIDRTLNERDRWDGELLHRQKDGTPITVESRQVLVRHADGTVSGILEVNRDITDRKRSEEELRRTAAEAAMEAETLRTLMEHIPEGVAIVDAPDCSLRLISRHGLEMIAPHSKSVFTTPPAGAWPAWEMYHVDGKTPAIPEEWPLTRALSQGKTVRHEEWIVRREGGESASILCDAAPIRGRDGAINGAVFVWRDISERKKLEEKLRETARLESLGIMAGGIAHDFNNLLTGVMGSASLLLDDLPTGTAASSLAKGIADAAERAATLTRQMLAYSGKGRFVVEAVDLSRYVRASLPLLHASIPRKVELRLDLADDLPLIEADAGQLQQVLINLVANGAEAIREGAGRVDIVTRAEQVDATYIKMLTTHGNISPGLYVVLEIRDTGCGIDQRTIDRIFDPFYTTKFVGRGLGLSAVQGIVRGHNGAIRVESELGAGTIFRVLLPAVSAAVSASAAADVGRFRGSGTVLVVDDEEIVRSTAATALQRLGFEVLVAEDGISAVEAFRANSSRLSLVLIDMTMPGPSCEETIRRLREIRPDSPIVVSSGFSEAEVLRRLAGSGLSGFLPKPYTVAVLAEKVAAATAGIGPHGRNSGQSGAGSSFA
jgi:PAS domain S-box-containing protein